MATNSNSPGGCPPCPTAAEPAAASTDVNWTQAQPPTCEPSTTPPPAASPLALVGVSLKIPERAAGKAWRPGTAKCSLPKEDKDEDSDEDATGKITIEMALAASRRKEELAIAAKQRKSASVRGTSLLIYPADYDDDDSLPDADLNQLLLGDTTVDAAPVHLRMLLQHCGDLSAMTPAELLFLLAYIAALEAGYMPKDADEDYGTYSRLPTTSTYNSQNVRRFSSRCPKYTKDARKMRFSIALQSIVDFETPEQPQQLDSLLTGIVSGDFIIITLMPDPATNQCGRSICLSVPRYVHSSQPRGSQVQQRFQKLDELSKKLRETLFVPLRNQQMLLLGQQRYPSLEGLPGELYDDIFRYLSDNQLNSVANVCRCLRDEARRCIARRCIYPSVDTTRCGC